MTPEQYATLQEKFLQLRNLNERERESELQQLTDFSQEMQEQLRGLLDADHSDLLEDPAASLGEHVNDENAGVQNADQATQTFSVSAKPAERPERIGPFQILQQIGEGGHGAVFMAEQKEPIRRKVALKLIKPGMESKEILARFEAERQALALMKHPSIANVLDAGTSAKGNPYFVMELVHGLPIDEFCRRNRLSLAETLELFQQVCDAVHHAHRKGIIHRDLKPGNILVTLDSGKPLAKVIDFGIAKALHLTLTDKTMFTEYGQIVGTLEYMSPEQATMSQDLPDIRSDVYSLGVVLYVLLTGAPPISKQQLLENGIFELGHVLEACRPPTPSLRFTEGNSAQDWRQFSETDRRQWAHRLRGDLDWITMKALAKDPKQRYDSPAELALDLENFLQGRAIIARPPDWRYEAVKWVKRNRVAALLMSSFVACLLVSLSAISWAYLRTSESLSDVREANALVVEKAVALEESLAETKSQRARADASSRRLAQKLKQEILKDAWSQALDGEVDGSRQQLASIPTSDRGYVWNFVDGVRQQVDWTSIRSESRGPLRATALHGKTNTLACVTTGAKIEIWDLRSGKLRHEAQLEPRILERLAFSEDGQTLMVGAPDWVGIYRVGTDGLESEYAHRLGGTRDICYEAARDRWWVTTGANYLLSVVSAEDGQLQSTLQWQLPARIARVQVSPTADRVVVADIFGGAFLVDSAGGQPQVIRMTASNRELRDFLWGTAQLIACDRRGRRYEIASESIDRAFAASSDSAKAEPLQMSPFGNSSALGEQAQSQLADVALVDAERVALANRDGGIHYLNEESNQVPIRRFSQAISRLMPCKQHSTLVVQHFNGRINVVSQQDIACREAYATQLADLTDGMALADHLHSLTSHQDGYVRKWQTQTGGLVNEQHLHNAEVLAMDVHEPTQMLVTYGADWRMQAVDLDSLKPRWSSATGFGVRAIQFSNSGQFLAGAGKRANVDGLREGTIDIWNAKDGTTAARLVGHSNWVMQIAFFDQDRKLASLALDGSLRVWDVASGEELLTIDLSQESNVAGFSLVENHSVLLGHQDGSLSHRSLRDGSLIRRNYLFSSAVSQMIAPRDAGVAFVSTEQSPQLTCVNVKELTELAELDVGVGTIIGLRVDKEFKRLQVAGEKGAARIWDLPQ